METQPHQPSWGRFLVWLNSCVPTAGLLLGGASKIWQPFHLSTPSASSSSGSRDGLEGFASTLSSQGPSRCQPFSWAGEGASSFKVHLWLVLSCIPARSPPCSQHRPPALTHEQSCGGRDLSQVPRRPPERLSILPAAGQEEHLQGQTNTIPWGHARA